MCESTCGVHLLVLVAFVLIIGDIIKQFTKRFHDKELQENNFGNIVEKAVDNVVKNLDNLNEAEGTELDLMDDKTNFKGSDESISDNSKSGSDNVRNEDDKKLSDNNIEQLIYNGQLNMKVMLRGLKKVILFVIENMLPHFIFGKIYNRYNGLFEDQERSFPPFLWINFLSQGKESTRMTSLNRFISFTITRTALNLVYCILYPLIYGIEYKPNVPRL